MVGRSSLREVMDEAVSMIAPVLRMDVRIESISGEWPSVILGSTNRIWGCL